MGRFFALTTIAAAVLFFPIVQNFDVYGDVGEKKFTFSLSMYGVFRLVGGYASVYRGGIALHVSKKKAILLPYTGMEEKRKKFSFVRSFRLLFARCAVETGAEYFPFAVSAHAVAKTLLYRMGKEKNAKLNLWLLYGDVLRVSARITVYFTPFTLLFLAAKFVIDYICGRAESWKKKEKSIVS